MLRSLIIAEIVIFKAVCESLTSFYNKFGNLVTVQILDILDKDVEHVNRNCFVWLYLSLKADKTMNMALDLIVELHTPKNRLGTERSCHIYQSYGQVQTNRKWTFGVFFCGSADLLLTPLCMQHLTSFKDIFFHTNQAMVTIEYFCGQPSL